MSNITRFDPFNTLAKLQDEVTRLFDEPGFRSLRYPSSMSLWTPPVDIVETEQEIVLKAELPGMEEKDIDVRVENNMLTVSGERKYEKDIKEENVLRKERYFGSFSRSFSLPNTVKVEAIKAEYKNGLLSVTLPKREEAKPKQIKVAVTNAK